MDELFGIPMTTIMVIVVTLFGISIAGILAIYLSNRIMFRMGLRNIPRRRAQSTLVVLGLMLSTLIITAAFTTGDTIDYSITKGVYDTLQRADLELNLKGEGGEDGASQIYVSESLVPTLEQQFAGDADIEAFFPYLIERVPAINPRTKLSEPSITLTGIDPERIGRLSPLTLSAGGKADMRTLTENKVMVSERLAEKIEARPGDILTLYARDTAWQVEVIAIVKDELASGVNDLGNPNESGGMAASLATVQRITGHPGQINAAFVALRGDVRSSVKRSDTAEQKLQAFFDSSEAKTVLGLGELKVKVEPSKQEGLEQAELFGNVFTTFFLVLGLFSIAAGVLLIFMIFVMLAAERKVEMGMARAVGAKRINLVQSFSAEGMAYNVMAGAVGAALGVGAAFLLVVVGARLVADELSFFTAHVTPRSLIISYCLGVVLTFITVVISSFRVSLLNIAAAVRDEDATYHRTERRTTRWPWVVLGVLTLPLLPLGLWLLLRRGLGLPWALILGPLGLLLGLVLLLMSKTWEQAFPFTLGVSLLPLSAAAIARHFRAPSRAVWTTVGLLLLAFWLIPVPYDEWLLGEKMSGNIEMFVLSGIMIVTAFTTVIVFNARLLTKVFEGVGGGNAYRTPLILLGGVLASVIVGLGIGDRGSGLGQLFYLLAALIALLAALAFAAARFPRFAPALKMGIAYPLSSRFRTGMTIAMFSLIVFSITTFSVINANFAALFSTDEARGGWDIQAFSNRNNPVDDLPAALQQEGTFDTAQITDAARVSGWQGTSEVRQVVIQADGTRKDKAWKTYPVRAGDDAFWAKNQAVIDIRARGMTDRAIFEKVRTEKGYAVIDALPTQTGNFGGELDWTLEGVTNQDEEFEPFQVEFRDPVTGKHSTLTVIGVWSTKIPSSVHLGVYTNEVTYSEVFGRPEYRTHYLRLSPGTDAEAAAKAIEAALVTKGVEAESIQKMIDDANAQGVGFTRIFQAFMGLGLFVGIAALGVIAFRSVVERRQQIGMLRAIGYQRGTVSLTFMLESSFVAMMGILSGVVGAAILSRNLFSSDEFTGTSRTGTDFFIPWGEVVVFVLVAYLFALLMTWWPSRGAAQVPIADALRYE